MPMKVAIVGAGGVGGYYGGLLAREGQEVTFVARGQHLEAMRKDGLQIKSIHGDFTVQPACATDHLVDIGPVDLVLICTKTYAMDAILPQLPALIGPQTVVVSLQNGSDAAERLGAAVGRQHVLGGATWLSSAVEAPGVIRQISQFRRVVIGELDGTVPLRTRVVAETFFPTGVTFEISRNIAKILWTKFVFIASISGVGSLTRLELGAYRQVPETRALLAGLMGEVASLASREGVSLDADVVEKTLQFIDQSEAHIKPSMQRDVENRKIFELDAMIGVIGRKARQHNLPTPIADMVYGSLLPGFLAAGK